MKVDYIALSIPVFFILIGVELIIAYIQKRELYRFNDAITNISLGIGQQVIGLFMKTALFFGYLFLFTHYRYFTIPATWLNWCILFIGVDFFYYWFHRLSHEVNAMWAAHIVHHQSEEYNLSVALRQSWFQSAFSWVFYLPLAIAGFDPIMFLTISSFNTLYQFWIHTRAINRMGFLEWFMNTPSHHRVHHGSNKKYLDKNHAGTLIIWDRMFGTFQEEEEEPDYGITKPLESWNPFWANWHYWSELFQVAKSKHSIFESLKVFLKSPADLQIEPIVKSTIHDNNKRTLNKYDNHPQQKHWNYYVLFLFVCALIAATLLLFLQHKMNVLQLVLTAVFVLLTLLVCGGILENKRWMKAAEYLRLLFMMVAVFAFYNQSVFSTILFSTLLVAVSSTMSFILLTRK
ncbi:MAG TPA: sterol desaturase family protein [Bacteroidia bacterium]|nr:sterol desaturase family protein [Bacteroidia bacterium]HRH07763.1 sterol desaturase family protein [Bacteroidia bacterium]